MNGNIRFRFVNQAVRNFALDTSPEFRDFVLASHLRLRLVDYFTTLTSLEHRYYSIQEIAVAARSVRSYAKNWGERERGRGRGKIRNGQIIIVTWCVNTYTTTVLPA